MRKWKSFLGAIIPVIIFIVLYAMFWGDGGLYFISILLTSIALGNLCKALLQGKAKKIGKSLAQAILLIGIAISIVTQLFIGLFLTFVAYNMVKSGLKRYEDRYTSQAHNQPLDISMYPRQPSIYTLPSTNSTVYNQGYQAQQSTPPALLEDEPYYPYYPGQTQTSTSTTQFEQPQVDYPELLPPQ